MPDSALTANARHPEHVDLFWIDRRGQVQNVWRDDTTAWHPPYPINPPTAPASIYSGLASASRLPQQVDLFWVSQASSAVVSTFWNDANPGWVGPFDITAAAAAAIDSQVSAVARTPDRLDLLWTGQGGELVAHWWEARDALGGWLQHTPQIIARPGSVGPRYTNTQVVVTP